MIEIQNQPDNTIIAVINGIGVSVLPDGEAKAFKRRAIRKDMTIGATEEMEWLVVSLNGVRVYCNGENIVVTTQDLYP